jgi:hypothetical protein
MDFFTDQPAAAASGCKNCGTCHDRYLLHEYLTVDGQTLTLCDECCAEERRIEALAVALAALPGCEDRQRIVDACHTAPVLVNRLRGHDLAQCAACAATRAAGACCEGKAA